MSIARRSDGRFIVKYRDALGKWCQRSFRKEAEAIKFDGETAYDEVDNERPTLLECVLAFLDNTTHSKHVVWQFKFDVLGNDKKDGTHTEGPAEILANRYVDTLSFRDLCTVRDNCRARGMSNASINICTARLNAAMNWAACHDMIDRNPWSKYGRLEASHGRRTGTLEAFQKVYSCCAEWLQWACRTCLALCLRPGMSELFSLKWQAFNWRERAVTVFMGKTNASKTVYPPEEYLSEAWERYCLDGKDGEKHVCRNRQDKPATMTGYTAAWKAACKKAGVHIPMYAIRHIAASKMLEEGADLAAVAAQLGHANAATTGKYYLHAMPAAQKRAGRALSWCSRGQFGAAETGES